MGRGERLAVECATDAWMVSGLATYSVDGCQYVVIACGGGKMGTMSGDAWMAFALPE